MTNCFLKAEEKLKEAAKKVFLEKGFEGTTTRDIAQEAGLNSALVNYYFRSKEKLFNLIFEELFHLYFQGMVQLLDQPVNLKDKITGLIDHDFQHLKDNPDLTTFIHNEVHRNPECFLRALPVPKSLNLTGFQEQLQQAIAAGEVRPITVPHLMQLIMANVQFIFRSKLFVTRLWQLSEADFDQFVTEHQQIVKSMITNYLFTTKTDG